MSMDEFWKGSIGGFSFSKLESKEGAIIWLHTGGDLEQIYKALTLSRETVDDIFIMIRRRSLEKETKIRQHWSHLLFVDCHSCEKFTENNHINHERSRKQRILTNIVRSNGIRPIHKN